MFTTKYISLYIWSLFRVEDMTLATIKLIVVIKRDRFINIASGITQL